VSAWRIVLVVGARPNFMKAAPVHDALAAHGSFEPLLVHTGQHYDERMSELFFRDLGMPRPVANLDARSGSHAVQTAEVMVRFERWLDEESERNGAPAAVLVFGDINSTVACSLVAAKAGIPLVHVEAGLRSFDRSMPEELNRLCTDALADLCYVTEASGVANLEREGRDAETFAWVGNTMIDTLLRHRERAAAGFPALAARLGIADRGYAVVTLHRPSNVDRREPLEQILAALADITAADTGLHLVWPAHPRFRARVAEFGLADRLERIPRLTLLEPQGYLDFLALVDHAALVLTDSGGIQEEACVLRVPCVTLRDNTERPSTLEAGGNVLVGAGRARIVAAARAMAALDRERIAIPRLWDGAAGGRIASDLARRLASASLARRIA
jgi:UDP-N-acetylglucosamine 2-epimerase (non-hydrolysing)